MQRRRIPAAFFLIRNIGRPYCCCGEGRGGAERGEAAEEGRPGRCGAVHARLMQAGRDGIAAAGRGGAGLGRGGGRGVPSDVGLGVARRVGRMGRAGTAKGEPQQQRWRNPHSFHRSSLLLQGLHSLTLPPSA